MWVSAYKWWYYQLEMPRGTHLGRKPTDISATRATTESGAALVVLIMITRCTWQQSPGNFEKIRFVTHKYCRI